mmetsp:Transcript_27753/g.67303  ORF Transcript_27753/g.67303 Transcript_27753/m.67303 type:complete len:228 (+) Transcript_27753:211-894(+)
MRTRSHSMKQAARKRARLLLVDFLHVLLVKHGDALGVCEPQRLVDRLHQSHGAVEPVEVSRQSLRHHRRARRARGGDEDDLGGAHHVDGERDEVAVGARVVARESDAPRARRLHLRRLREDAAAVSVGAGAEQHHVEGGQRALVVHRGVRLEQRGVLRRRLGGGGGGVAVHLRRRHAQPARRLERAREARRGRQLLVAQEEVHLLHVEGVRRERAERGDDRSAGDSE